MIPKNALLLFYIVMFGAYFENLFSCDLQKLFRTNLLVKHVLAFISAFFLILLMDDDSVVKPIGTLFLHGTLLYVLYILSTKSKQYFVIPLLIILFVDQIIGVEMNNRRLLGGNQGNQNLSKVRDVFSWSILVIIITGFIHYYIRARMEFKANFKHSIFFLGTNKCEKLKKK